MRSSFKLAFLHPRHWVTWAGLGLLWLLVQLPYPVLSRLGETIGKFSRRFLKRRERIARRNLELCFPDMTEAMRDAMIEKNFMSLGMGLFETGMAWFWPDRRVEWKSVL